MQKLVKPNKITAYENTDVTADQTVAEVNEMLQKFGVGNIFWNTINPENSYIVFDAMEGNQKLCFKVGIPYVTKSGLYNQAQAFRIVYHKIKALMIDLELGSKVFEVFATNLVIGARGSEPISITERNSKMITDGKLNNIYLSYKDSG